MAENIGRLDGNERWNIVPAGRADMERTIERIDGIKIVSFSGREDKKDIINRVTLDFRNTEALLNFLDPQGKRAFLTQENGKNKLTLIINEPLPSEINGDLMELLKQSASGYRTGISFSADKNSTMTITDGKGLEIPTPQNVRVVSTGKKVSLSMDTADLLSLEQGLGLAIFW
jgi:hypothetical protein